LHNTEELCNVLESRMVLSGLRPSTAYTVVVEARRSQKHEAVTEGKK